MAKLKTPSGFSTLGTARPEHGRVVFHYQPPAHAPVLWSWLNSI